jgi:hypothetical protein
MEHPDYISHYHELGVYLANVSEWRPFIESEFATWIIVGTGVEDTGSYWWLPSGRFVSVIRSVWLPDFPPEHDKFVTLATEGWIFAVAALSRVWQTFEVSTPEFLRLARCTVSIALRKNHCHNHSGLDNRMLPAISSNLREIFSRSLGESLIQAARRVRDGSVTSDETVVPDRDLERVAEFMDVLGGKISTEFEPNGGEVTLGGKPRRYEDWSDLDWYFRREVDMLEKLLSPEPEEK